MKWFTFVVEIINISKNRLTPSVIMQTIYINYITIVSVC